MGILTEPRRKPPLGSRLDYAHPLSRGLVGMWLMNEGAGSQIADLTLSKKHGALTDMDPATDWVVGERGPVLDFDGSNDFIDIGSGSATNPTAGITVSVWFNARTLSGQNWFISRDDNTLGRSYALGYTFPTHQVEFQVNGEATIRGGAVLSTDTWYNLVGTGNGTVNYSAYVNGALYDTGTASDPNVTTGNTNIGRRSFASNEGYVDGLIDDIRIWNRALEPTEIQALYEDPYQNIIVPSTRRYFVPAVAAGRIMSSLVASGGLAGRGGIAGPGGGLAGSA